MDYQNPSRHLEGDLSNETLGRVPLYRPEKMAAGHVFLVILLRISLSLYLLKFLKFIFCSFITDTV